MNAPTAFPDPQKPVPPYRHTPLFPLGEDTTPYKKVMTEGVRVEKVLGKDMLVVSREALRALSEAAFGEITGRLWDNLRDESMKSLGYSKLAAE